jgi:uncharacterized protein (TIGR03435 family)
MKITLWIFALAALRNSRKTECGAKQFLTRLAVRAAPFALFGSSLLAQSITGAWQGTGQVNGMNYRVVVKVSTTDADTLKGVMYPSIDQSGESFPLGAVTAQGSVVKFTAPSINGNYEGKLSADGNTMTGTWSIGETHVTLNLTRATPQTAWTIPEPLPPPKLMDPNAKPEFEVATIKPSDPNQPGWALVVNRSGMLNTHNTTLADLIKFAYDLHPKQVIGAPAWFDTDKFDVEAKPSVAGMPTGNQLKIMLQKLLVDRFSLVFRNDKKELSAYAITVAKGGEKIKKEENSDLPLPGFGGRPQSGFNIHNATMAEFASVIQAQFMDLPVVDHTGFGATRYSFILKFTPDPTMRPFGGAQAPAAAQPTAADPDAPPDLFYAMEQLGLHMQKTKAPVEVMVIDKIEKPSPN